MLEAQQLAIALLWTAALCCCWALVKQWHRARKLDMDLIPGPWQHGSHPLFGNLKALLRPDFHRLMLEWANQYGGIFRVKALWYDGLVVSDPAVVAAICGRGQGALDKSALMYQPINQMCSPRAHPNLLTSSADATWRVVRKAVAAAFSVNNIRKKFPVVRGCSQKLIDQLVVLSRQAVQAGKPPVVVDMDQAALRVTLDVIGLAGFDHDFQCLNQACLTQPAPAEHLLRVLPRCFTEVMLRIVNPVRALAPSWFHNGIKGDTSFHMFQQEMSQLTRKCLLRPDPPPDADVSIGAQLWRAYYNQEPSPPPLQLGQGQDNTSPAALFPVPSRLQLLGLRLMQLWCAVTGAPLPSTSRPAAGQPHISVEHILSEIGILFIEGFETTGHTTSWALVNIATAPGVQDRIAEELDGLGLLLKPGAAPGALAPLEMEHLHKLTFLTACVKEAMRMLPVVSVMSRTVGSEPTRVGPFLVPAHTPVGIPLFVIHNSTANWERPGDFIPGRWLNVPVESYVMGTMPPLPATPTPSPAPVPVPTPPSAHPEAQPVPADTSSSLTEYEPDSSSSKVPSSRGSSGGEVGSPTSSSGAASSDAWLAVLKAGAATPQAAAGPGIKSHPLLDYNEAQEEEPGALPLSKVTLSKVALASQQPTTTRSTPTMAAAAAPDVHVNAPAGEVHMSAVTGSRPVQQPAPEAASGKVKEANAGGGGGGGGGDAKRGGGGVRFMPFSEGPRSCVGQTLAKMEVMALLAQLLGTFRVELAPEMGGLAGVRSRESTHLTLQTRGTHGVKFVLHPRWMEPTSTASSL